MIEVACSFELIHKIALKSFIIYFFDYSSLELKVIELFNRLKTENFESYLIHTQMIEEACSFELMPKIALKSLEIYFFDNFSYELKVFEWFDPSKT